MTFSELDGELSGVVSGLLKDGEGERLLTDWLGLEAPGADATFAEVAAVLREIGRAAAHTPYPAAALGVGSLTLLARTPDRDQVIHAAASGAVLPILALDGETAAGTFRLRQTLDGDASFVLDAPTADHLLIPALDSQNEPVIVGVAPRTPGLTVAEQPVVDATRGFGRVVAEAVVPGSVWRFNDPDTALRRLADRAAVAIACDSLGLSEAMLDATVAYAGVREQFGRTIGSFQAVKHACADMLVQVTLARRLVAAAVRGVATDETGVAVSRAKSYACTAAVEIAGKAVQLHGGMGYTWEAGIHAYLKRAVLNRSLYGSPAQHRERVAEHFVDRRQRTVRSAARVRSRP
ncbi:acyl-CoA/acyl-ACP dehydrogenase [Actinomadura barringtoniae]|uniref:Acyl-CoA/acyl-ACP dehydrogenase n=1 Tax=Actinomadura barringtoniae TaxID=1427535 RepID=A0A939PDK9_9ACTN|nr:acyl-CoA dehydrogenase family protein [Actinomadura barringtoniae]MBO2447734.1 acyl-CoA/acyl-ACP dehydrogenase [Actinomadura barringtoniae]